MGVENEALLDVLKHPIRRKTIIALSKTHSLSYTELMKQTQAANTGKLNYHLKILADLIEKDQNGKYHLTQKGQNAAQLLTAANKKTNTAALRTSDAALIGFAGFVLTVANPGFWGFAVAAWLGVESLELFSALNIVMAAFGLVVPGALMWFLSARRAGSHKFYELLKAPLLMVPIAAALLLVMVLLHAPVGVQVAIPLSQATVSHTAAADGPTVSMSQFGFSLLSTSLLAVVVAGMAFSFVGVTLAECARRLKKKVF
ncbi:MAG: hypothetical protein NWF04_07355 [Candidatus Bathyarchaeota archaeon]|nr:hypothetical protein [Candidatus Bathyarchaeota archaeon]